MMVICPALPGRGAGAPAGEAEIRVGEEHVKELPAAARSHCPGKAVFHMGQGALSVAFGPFFALPRQ